LSLAVVTNAFPQAKVERALGMVFGIAAVGQAFGPLIGGGLTATLGWRSVLLVNVPVSAALIALAYTSIDESRDESMPRHIDWLTAAGTIGNVGTSTAIYTSMILLQQVRGLSASAAGVAFLGFSLGVATASQISGRVERFPSWPSHCCAAVSARSRWGWSAASCRSSWWPSSPGSASG
jgi:MFS family permease